MIHLKIRDRQATVFEGEVTQLSSINEVGPFDVMENHSNFISVIKDIVSFKVNGQKQEFKLTNGVLKARDNKVNVYLGVKK